MGVAATDNRTLITFKDNEDVTLNVNIYDITSDKWKKELPLTVPSDSRQAMRAAVDPNTGLVYVNSNLFMHVFDPRDNTIQATRIVGTPMPKRKFAGVAYLKPHKTIIYMGGLDGHLKYGTNMDIWEYNPASREFTDTWVRLSYIVKSFGRACFCFVFNIFCALYILDIFSKPRTMFPAYEQITASLRVRLVYCVCRMYDLTSIASAFFLLFKP